MIKTKKIEKTVKRPGKQSRKLFFKSDKRYSQTFQSYMKINYTHILTKRTIEIYILMRREF